MGAFRVIDPAKQLGTTKSSFLLNQIDKIRANGVGNHVSLPQLVVCGDQSAGKSSVLERLTDIPFPRQDGLCTRFATEIILRHSDGPREVIATIRPDRSRDPESREVLQSYKKRVSDFSELPSLIEETAALMGLRGYGGTNGSAFALDALRIEVSGATGVHLTIVDLPGLISVPNEEQSNEDIKTVHRLVDDYLESSRTIILAVVQATNDIANQSVIQKAKEFDPDGVRTVGIITKPDLVNKGTETRIARLASNEDNVKLKLGFFLLKNPSPEELIAAPDPEASARAELEFFAKPPWNQLGIDLDRVGSCRLKQYLQDLLHEHIEKEIPKVKEELKQKLRGAEVKLLEFGHARTTLNEIRSFVTERSMSFHNLAQASLQGHYLGSDSKFFKNDTRLRALVHQLNASFAEHMRLHGSTRVIKQQDPPADSDDESIDENKNPPVDSDDESIDENQTEQLRVSQKEMLTWVKKIYVRTRGLELPGNYNHILLAELYQIQSCRWLSIAETHLDRIVATVASWLRQALASAVKEELLLREMASICQEKLDQAALQANKELQLLWEDEKRHPITYNHYYTNNIQKCRQNVQREAIQEALNTAIREDFNGKMHISNHATDIARISSALQNRVIVNMDERACKEALEGMEAYYKVSRKTFVDNVCRQVVERHILVPLPTFFSPTAVSELSDVELLRIGSEPEKKQAARTKLLSLAECMRASLKELNSSPLI